MVTPLVFDKTCLIVALLLPVLWNSLREPIRAQLASSRCSHEGPNDLLSQNASQLFVNTWFLVGACNRLSMDFIMTSSGAEFTHWCSLWDIHVAPLSLIQMLSPGRGATCHAFCSACPLPLPCFGEWWSIVVPLHISIRQALKTKKLFRCHAIVSVLVTCWFSTEQTPKHIIVFVGWRSAATATCAPVQNKSKMRMSA